MLKRLLPTSVALLGILAATAGLPRIEKAQIGKSAMTSVMPEQTTSMEKGAQTNKFATEMPDYKASLKEMLAASDPTELQFCESPLSATQDEFAAQAQPQWVNPEPSIGLKMANVTKSSKLETGTLISKDLNYKDIMYSFRLTLEDGENAGSYTLSGLYGREEPVEINVDSYSGLVTIPQQVVYTHSTYGEVSLVPLRIEIGEDGAPKFYMVKGDLHGFVLEDGSIRLATWGLAVTQMDPPAEEGGEPVRGKYYGQLFNIFKSSDLKTPNTVISGYNISQNKLSMYEALFEQTAANEMTLYGFCNLPTSDVLTGRLTTDKRILVSPHVIYNNMLYGPFCNYPADFTYDETTSKWSVKVNSKENMILQGDGKGSFTIPGYVISAKSQPTTIAYAWNDIKIACDAEIKYPEPVTLNLPGNGTAESPYVIQTVGDLDNLAMMSDAGESFAGICFELGSDIDFTGKSSTSWATIGNTSAPFEGTFDGKGHKISNFSANGKGFHDTGLFGVIGKSGVIKDIQFEKAFVTGIGENMGVLAGEASGKISGITVNNSSVDCDGVLGGGIVGNLAEGGVLTDCSFSGSVTSVCTAAGIAGQSVRADIKNCTVNAAISLDGSQSTIYKEGAGIVGTMMIGNLSDCSVSGTIADKLGYAHLGGVVGYLYQATMTDCFNTAAISAKRAVIGGMTSADEGETSTGGLIGMLSDSKVNRCYNSGTIIKTDKSDQVGGLVGYLLVSYVYSTDKDPYMKGISDVSECYTSGQIISTSTDPMKGLFGDTFLSSGFKGPKPYEVTFKNCWYDSQVLGMSYPEWSKTTAQLTSGLPEGWDSKGWKITEGLYPVLTASAASQAQALSAAPLVMRDNDDCIKVKVSFKVVPADNVTWALDYDAEAGETPTETAALKMNGNEVTIKDQYANALVTATSADGWGLKLYRLAVVPKVFEGEGTKDDPFLLSTVEDWKKLDEAVGTYGQAHRGDYFVMPNDIDFSKAEDFQGVAAGTCRPFSGSFDGTYHQVHGLKLNAVVLDNTGKADTKLSKGYYGLFSAIGAEGSVRNLTIAPDNEFMFLTYSGAVVGANLGTIQNVRNYATINAVTSYTGGIAGLNSGKGLITKCYNAGQVNYGLTCAGGIAGFNNPEATISFCQNDGDIVNTVVNKLGAKYVMNTVGGISGDNLGVVENCVNNATVRGYNKVGGIVGHTSAQSNNGHVRGNVNNGVVTAHNTNTTDRGGVIGQVVGSPEISGNWYDASLNVNGGANNKTMQGVTGLSSSEMISATEMEGTSGLDFKEGSYPVLRSFANEEASKALRAIYVAFAPKQLRTNVLVDVPLAKADGLVFSLRDNAFVIEGDMLKGATPEGLALTTDSITATLNDKYSKSFMINAVPVVLDGEGTAEAPYLIKTPADWNKLAEFMETSKWEYLGNHFKVDADLDFAGDSIKVLGVNGTNFQAILDGASHTVKNYKYDNPNQIWSRLKGPNLYTGKYLGLIGNLGGSGVVKNFVLDGEFKAYGYAASMVGENYGTVENIVNKGSVQTTGDNYAAGIVYRSHENAIIRNCVNEGEVISKKGYASGIVNLTLEGSLVEGCVNKGSIQTTNTAAVAGIAYSLGGGMKECHNKGTLTATSNIAGIVNTVAATGWMEGCSNSTDLDFSGLTKPASNIFGIANSLTNRKTDSPEGTGFIKDCHNTGIIKGGATIIGAIGTIGHGWTVSDCSNTGDVIAVNPKSALAAGFASKVGGAKEIALLSTIERCYNSGVVSGAASGVAGFIATAENFSYLADCYNLGDVTNAAADLATGGVVGKHNGFMERCFNSGNVVTAGYAGGGLVGYMAKGDKTYPAKMLNSFNIGDVTSTYNGNSTNGNAGGLGGYLSTCDKEVPHSAINCYNTGNITAENRSAGLFAGAFSPLAVVENCYNAGKVTCNQPDSQGRYYWSGTTFSNNYKYVLSEGDTVLMLAGHKNCFYDSQLNPGQEFRSVTGSKKTTDQLRKLKISEGFINPEHGGFPLLTAFKDHDVANAGSALVLLASKTGEAYDNVTEAIMLVGPTEAEWTATGALSIENGKAIPTATGEASVTCKHKGFSKTFVLKVTSVPDVSNVEDSFADKDVKSVEIIDLSGRKVMDPQPGQVYIIRTIFNDGTTKVEKRIVQN